MKYLPLFLTLTLFSSAAYAQNSPAVSAVAPPEAAKLDSLTKLSQQFLNNNQVDSLYALMGPAFKQQISIEKMKEIAGQFSSQLGKWGKSELRGVKDGVGRYKATFATTALDFYISQDKQGKIETFMFKPLE